MRYVKSVGQLCLIAVIVLATGGCAARRAAIPAAGTPVAPALPDAKAAVPAAAPLSAAVLHAFEEANRALKAGKMEEAERAYKAIVLSNPELGGPHANLGVIYRSEQKLPASLAELSEAVRLNPTHPVYQNELGVTYRQLGQFDKARASYEQAIAHDPNYASAILNLGILSDMYLDDAKGAMLLYTRYMALTPQGDATVAKWIAELKNRKPAALAGAKEKS